MQRKLLFEFFRPEKKALDFKNDRANGQSFCVNTLASHSHLVVLLFVFVCPDFEETTAIY